LPAVGDGERSRAPRIVYGAVLTAVALGGLFTIVDWARRGNELPGGGLPVIGRVVAEEPGFGGALAVVEVAYEAGGEPRRARLAVPSSDDDRSDTTYEPGDAIALVVSRTDPERVRHANWASDAPATRIPGWLIVVAAVGVFVPVLLPGARRRLEAAIAPFRSG
jgi:hypothetical protein